MTKLQRHTAYIIMLKESKGERTEATMFGLCYLAYRTFNLSIYNFTEFKNSLPELFAKKPDGVKQNDHWFPCDESGWKKRRELLKQCINETL